MKTFWIVIIIAAFVLSVFFTTRPQYYGTVIDAYSSNDTCYYVLQVGNDTIYYPAQCCRYGYGDTININK